MTREHTSCHFLDGRLARWHNHCAPFIIISLFSFLILFTHRIFCVNLEFSETNTQHKWYLAGTGRILVSSQINIFATCKCYNYGQQIHPDMHHSFSHQPRWLRVVWSVDPILTQAFRIMKWNCSNIIFCFQYMGVSKNRGTPKSSILIGFSIINHPFWDTMGYPIFGNTHIFIYWM